MDFLQKLQALGLYYEKPGEGGGGGQAETMSPEELTNKKLAGESVETKPEGGKESEPKGGEEKPPGQEKPEGGKSEGEEDPMDEVEKKAAAKKGEGEEPAEGEESEEPEFYYDPEKHVEGEPAHSNKFPTREKAEFAAINKAEMLRAKLEEMKEDGVDRGAVPLPKALNGDPDAIENMTDLEIVHSMSDDELRGFLNESDASRQRLESRYERKKKQKEAAQAKNEFEEMQIELYNDLEKILDANEIQNNLSKFGDLEEGKDFVRSKVNEKIKSELADDRQELEDWIDKVDSGEIQLSIKEFDREKQKRLENINSKREQLQKEYSPVIDKLEKTYNLAEKVESGGGDQTLSPQEKAKRMRSARDEMEQDLKGDLDLLADDSDARAEYVAAQKWAITNKADYNDLQHPSDWARAIQNGWPEHKKKVRSARQREELEGGKGGDKSADDINKPGDQRKLEGIEARNVQSRNRKALDKLEEMTNAKVGT